MGAQRVQSWAARALGVLLVCVAVQIAAGIQAAAQNRVEGTVVNTLNRPIPGLTVSLAHATVGRSFPAFTDAAGHFVFYSVPAAPSPYYLELYWGQQLLYRRPVLVNTPLVRLPPIILR